MRHVTSLAEALPDFARDIRLNLKSLLDEGGMPELSEAQRWGVAVAAAHAARQPRLTQAIEADARIAADAASLAAARSAAAIMAMTNVYYRGVHMAGSPALSALPAGLRMNGLASHQAAQADVELFGLAASAVKGCEACIKAHVTAALKQGCAIRAIQAAIRLAAVVHAAAASLDVPGLAG